MPSGAGMRDDASTAIAVGDLRIITALWGLGEIRQSYKPATGVVNRTAVVETIRGRFVIRRHRRDDLSHVLQEHAIMAHARSGGVPAPRPVAIPGGESVVRHSGALWSIFEHAHGAQIPRDQVAPSHAHSMGATLAKLHTVLQDFPMGDEAGAALPTLSGTLETITKICTVIESKPFRTQLDHCALERLRSRGDWLKGRPEAALSRPDELWSERQAIHGDYQESNLFFSGANVVAVIDWDQAKLASPALEVLRSMDLALKLNPRLADAFLRGYRCHRDMTRDDLEAAARSMAFHRAHDLWLYKTVYLEGDSRPQRFISSGAYVPFMEKWRPFTESLGAAL